MGDKQKYLLRVEGVNLSNFVFDTTDLSTIRGGGLLLLEAIDRAHKKLDEFAVSDSVKAISTGASSGLFEFQAESGEEIRNKIADFLNKKDSQLKHATFVTDVIETDGTDFSTKKEKLLAMNRWRQMQSPSLAVPNVCDTATTPCEKDFIRPRFQKYKTSASVWERSQYGRKQKRGDFYTKLTGFAEKSGRFTNDLTKLSEDRTQGNLNHKIAVIYADGNSFGALQSGFGKGTLHDFDEDLKFKRKSFLSALIELMCTDSDGWKNDGAYRLETLLWGGDEFMLVVPAWKGWETLQLFYQLSEKWQFKYQQAGKEVDKRLTHAAGLVFCHHNAPIHRIKTLAHDLAEVCKDKAIVGEKGNYFACQVLEAFDHIDGPVEDYLKKMSIDQKVRPMILSGEEMAEISESMAGIKGDTEFARGRLHGIVKQYRTGDMKEAEEEIETILNKGNVTTCSHIKELEKILGAGYCWLHLADLYDYISVSQKGGE